MSTELELNSTFTTELLSRAETTYAQLPLFDSDSPKPPDSEYGPRLDLPLDAFDADVPTREDEGEQVVREMKGVVYNVGESEVTVRLIESDVTVAFPRQLFQDESLLHYGQPLVYAIMRRATGLRYQRFLPGVDTDPNPLLEEVQDILRKLDSPRSG